MLKVEAHLSRGSWKTHHGCRFVHVRDDNVLCVAFLTCLSCGAHSDRRLHAEGKWATFAPRLPLIFSRLACPEELRLFVEEETLVVIGFEPWWRKFLRIQLFAEDSCTTL